MSAGLIAAIWNDKNTVIVFLFDSYSNDNTIVMMIMIYHDGLAVPPG